MGALGGEGGALLNVAKGASKNPLVRFQRGFEFRDVPAYRRMRNAQLMRPLRNAPMASRRFESAKGS